MTDIRAYERFSALPLFAQLADRDLTVLVDALARRLQVAKGTSLYLQGEYDRMFYLLDRGAARLLRVESDGIERVVGQLSPGDAVGENALFIGESRDATLEATEDSSFFTIAHDALMAFAAENPDIVSSFEPQPAVQRYQRASHLSWQHVDEVLLRGGRSFGWTLTTRRLLHRDWLGTRQIALRQIRDVRANHTLLVGNVLDIGRVEITVQGSKRFIWRGVRQPQRLADQIFVEVGRDQSRAHAEARARARRALVDQQSSLPLEPPHPPAIRSGEDDHLAWGLWRVADWLAARVLRLIGGHLTTPRQETPRSGHESSL